MADLNPARSERQIVYVGIWQPAADYPPKHPRIEKVFADEKSARAWALEVHMSSNSAYRRIEPHEVVA